MRVFPVLDLKSGVAVHAVAGRRSDYRPIRGPLCRSPVPLDVARAYRDRFGLAELYVADLDAIAGGKPSITAISALCQDGFSVWVDPGIRRAADAACWGDAGITGLIAGLETLASLDELTPLCQDWDNRLVFSLDLRGGFPLSAPGATETLPRLPIEIARAGLSRGVRKVLALDLERIGTGNGTGTEMLCHQLSLLDPKVEVWAGGGIAGREDLERLRSAGVSVVLVASALHDGRVTPAMLRELGTEPIARQPTGVQDEPGRGV